MTSQGFRRVVLGLQTIAPPHSVRLAADFAALLRADILGLFVEDHALHHFAELPFARELNLLGGGWRPIERKRLSDDLDVAARTSRRAFGAATRGSASSPHFEVVANPGSIEAITRPDDIVVILEPSAPADRIAHQFASLLDAAFRSGASVMFVPQRVARTAGPVLVLAASADEAMLRPAANLAAALATDLIVESRLAADSSKIERLAADLGIRITSTSAPRSLERMIVVGRDTLGANQVSEIAAARNVPVLLMDPERARAR